MNAQVIRQRLIEAFQHVEAIRVQTVDPVSQKYHLSIVCDAAFKGKPLLQRHKAVNAVLKTELLDGSIHALQMETFTSEETGGKALIAEEAPKPE